MSTIKLGHFKHVVRMTNGLIQFLKSRVRYDALHRPHYAYAIRQAALQAKALAIPRICAIEFGVAGGTGLRIMEQLAAETGRKVGIGIDVYGFDTGRGQPPPVDYRDCPYIWRAGHFKMEIEKLQSSLTSAKLVIGDVADTVKTFVEEFDPAPIGFIAFDLDYYSSTKAAFQLLEQSNERFLPRVFCYFDDIVGPHFELHCEFTGELLAINEFNCESANKKIARINGFRYKHDFPADWHTKMHVLHRFDHRKYCDFINPMGDWQMPLRLAGDSRTQHKCASTP